MKSREIGSKLDVKTQKIRFVANKHWLTEDNSSKPQSAGKSIPEWYKQADRYAKDPATGNYWEMPDVGGKIPTWKACPAVFDIMGTGYNYQTPCDLEFVEDAAGKISAKVLDDNYSSFLQERETLDQFPVPKGYHAKPFTWRPDWIVELPEGYSALYMHPLNRFELPFLTINGIIDNDQDSFPAPMPFFFLKGITGILPAGTPIAQILPFKREPWMAEVDASLTLAQMEEKNKANSARFRKPDGGIYLREVWERRLYK